MPQEHRHFRATWNVERLTSFGPVHRRRRATADALQTGGLAGEVLPIMTQRTNRIGGDDLTPPPSSQSGPQHPGARHDTPVVGGIGPNRHVGSRYSHPLLSHFDDDISVRRLLDDGIPGAAAQNVRHVVRTAGPTESDAHGGMIDPHDTMF